jgi:hypothetical protein
LREPAIKQPPQSIAPPRCAIQVLLFVQITARERLPGFTHHQTARCNVNG